MTETATKQWYIVHTYSGFEKKVAESLKQRVQAYGVQDAVGDVLIPTEDVVEMRGGRKVVTSKRFFPGYILVEMAMSDNSGTSSGTRRRSRGSWAPGRSRPRSRARRSTKSSTR